MIYASVDRINTNFWSDIVHRTMKIKIILRIDHLPSGQRTVFFTFYIFSIIFFTITGFCGISSQQCNISSSLKSLTIISSSINLKSSKPSPVTACAKSIILGYSFVFGSTGILLFIHSGQIALQDPFKVDLIMLKQHV